MMTLDDLRQMNCQTGVIIVHGIGNGGGEKVARKILAVYEGNRVDVWSHRQTTRELLLTIIKKPRYQSVLCTAGPRDIRAILLTRALGRKVDAYIQVPYLKALSLRDPIHMVSIWLFYAVVACFARRIFVNSAAVGAGLRFRRPTVIVPITTVELVKANAQRDSDNSFSNKPVAGPIKLVCRLVKERGVGSRDLAAIFRLAKEIGSYCSPSGDCLELWHYGEIDPSFRSRLKRLGRGRIRFFGHMEEWLQPQSGCYVFLSNYEGFGLAAFEAAASGALAIVNQAFPGELLSLAPRIKTIDTRDATRSILGDIQSACRSAIKRL